SARLDEARLAFAAFGGHLGAGLDALAPGPGRAAGSQIGLGCDPVATGGRGDHLALVHPDLDPDRADGRAGGGGAEVDVGSQRVQRDTTLPVPLAATHFGATQTALGLDAHTLGPGLHGGGDRPLHGAAEGNPVLELIGDAPGEEGGIQVGILDLVDVELHRSAGQVLEPGAETLRLRAAAADDDARTGGVDVHDQTVAGSLDVDS